MATKYWNATGASEDWATAGNWDPSGVPASNDVVIIDGRSQNNITAGLAQGAVDLQGLIVTEGYTGNIGDSSTPLTIAVSNETTISNPTMTYAGAGTCKIAAGTNGIDLLEIDRTQGGQIVLSGGTFVEVRQSLGTSSVLAAAAVTTMWVYRGLSNIAAHASTAITTLNTLSGVVNCSRNVTTSNIRGGQVAYLNSSVPATVNVQGADARVFHRASGTITNLNVDRGVWSPQGNPFASFTITNSRRLPGATLVDQYAGGSIVFSNETEAPGKDSPIL